MGPHRAVSIIPSKIPYGGFSPVRLQGRHFRRGLPDDAWPSHRAVYSRRSCSSWLQSSLAQCRGPQLDRAPPFERINRSAPGALAPVRVVVSRSIIAYSAPSAPLVGTRGFRRTAAYTPRLRCAFRPRRPASGSVLSLLVPSWHAALYDPGELIGDFCPVNLHDMAFAPLAWARRSRWPHHPFLMGLRFRGFTGSLFAAACQVVSLLDGSDRGFPPGRRDIYTRASDGSVTLSAAEYGYGGLWASSTGGTYTRWNSS